jgi:hypothetical protein
VDAMVLEFLVRHGNANAAEAFLIESLVSSSSSRSNSMFCIRTRAAITKLILKVTYISTTIEYTIKS